MVTTAVTRPGATRRGARAAHLGARAARHGRMVLWQLLPVVVLAVLEPGLAWAQTDASRGVKVANARSAAPPAIAEEATIMDWPAVEGGGWVLLQEGTNGWYCMPDMPFTEGNDPMCVDESWMEFYRAVMTRTRPDVKRIGISYMTAPGGSYGSNTDPYATGPTPDNEWGFDHPHLMILLPDPEDLEGLPTTRASGGPWVMYEGTPYAHIMVPVAPRR